MQSAEVCGEASYCRSCLLDRSMVVISKGISHRCVILLAKHLPFMSKPTG